MLNWLTRSSAIIYLCIALFFILFAGICAGTVFIPGWIITRLSI